jgi:hypothetical protein
MNDEFKLREYFASLRRAEAARTPTFQAVLGGARRPAKHGLWRLGMAAVVIAAAAVTGIRTLRHTTSLTESPAAPMLADWRASTDFLLDTPGKALLHTVPDVGHYPPPIPDLFSPTPITTPAPRSGREHS